MSSSHPAEPVAVVLCSAVVEWLIQTTAKFPRDLRFGLGRRIEDAATDVLEALVTAQYERGHVRADALRFANRRLQVLRHLNRLAVQLKVLSERQQIYISEKIIELGREVGGWRKASESTVNSSENSAILST